MPPDKLADWVALTLLPDVGPILARRALDRFRDPGEIAFRLSPAGWSTLQGMRPAIVSGILEARRDLRRRVDAELRACRKAGVHPVPRGDPAYPAVLETLPDPPVLLYMKGELAEGVVRVAVVGSRRATAYGRRVATGMASSLSGRGVEIVSGGARGIDAHAHHGALESGGRTVAVLGSGLARPYPAEHRDLYDRIASQGAVISEFPMDVTPVPANFPRRNRLISGLSAATVVVEAALRSGSLITAAHALEQGREVLAVPGPVSSEQSWGCHRLIQQGARLVQEVDDILEELSPMYGTALSRLEPPRKGRESGIDEAGLPEDETKVLHLLREDPEPVQLDDLAEKAPFGVARLNTALFGLEVRGLVERLPGRYYLSRPPSPDTL